MFQRILDGIVPYVRTPYEYMMEKRFYWYLIRIGLFGDYENIESIRPMGHKGIVG